MLSRTEPLEFLHHPLIFNARGQKLSKSAADTGVRELRAAGLSAADVIGAAARAVGLIDVPRPVRPLDVGALFDQGVA